jgi:hypothetical protein
MRPDDLLEPLRRRPFAPFRIHLTAGETYDVRHPDQIIVLRSRAALSAGAENGIPKHVDHVALVHIVRIEELPTESAN